MALTGTFDADFTSFYSAVETAKDKLRDMAGAADTVGQELSQVVDADVPGQMHELAGATEEVATANQDAGLSIGTMVAAYVSAEAIIGAVTAAFGALSEVITESLTAAADAEDAQAGLAAALTAQGTAVPSVVAAYDGYAAALQRTTRFSDDAVTAAEKILVQIGNVMPRDMERALKATTDLAAGLGKDLPEAAMLVAKAADGNVGALQRYGVQVNTAKGETADFDTVLGAIDSRFKGTAETMAGTFAGGLDQAANAWDNVKESIGRAITQNEAVKTAMKAVTDLLVTNTGELRQNATVNKLVSEAVILLAKGFSLAVEGIDLFQKELRDARMLTDSMGIGLIHLYELLQKIELATQKPIALLGGEAATQRVKAAGDALEWAAGAIQGFRDHAAEADKTSQDLSATLQGFRGNIDTLITRLETTTVQTDAVNTAQAEAPGIWARTTGAIQAQTVAYDDLLKAGDQFQKAMFFQAQQMAGAEKARISEELAGLQAVTVASRDSSQSRIADADATVTAVRKVTDAVTEQASATSSVMGQWQNAPINMAGISEHFLATYGPNANLAQIAAGQGPNPILAPGLKGTAGMDWFTGVAAQKSADIQAAQILLRSGTLGGSQGGVNFQAGAIQMQYPIVNDPQALDNLARVVGDAVMAKLTRSGAHV